MKIPREVVEEIIRRNDIEQVIGSYVTLKPARGNLRLYPNQRCADKHMGILHREKKKKMLKEV